MTTNCSAESLRSTVSAESQRSLTAVTVESPRSIHLQKIRNALRHNGDSTENAETALRIICSRVAVKIDKVWEQYI